MPEDRVFIDGGRPSGRLLTVGRDMFDRRVEPTQPRAVREEVIGVIALLDAPLVQQPGASPDATALSAAVNNINRASSRDCE